MLNLPPYPPIIPNSPEIMVGPEGSTLKSLFILSSYFDLQPGDEVDTLRLEFATISGVSIPLLRRAIDTMALGYARYDQEIVAYALWERVETQVTIPEQFCIGSLCWTPPWAGQTVLSTYHYRLWVLSRDRGAPMLAAPCANCAEAAPKVAPCANCADEVPSGVIAAPLGALAIAIVVAGLISVIVLIVGIVEMRSGSVTWGDIREFTEALVTSPGENVARALGGATAPLLALGVSMALVSSAVAYYSIKGTVPTPVGPLGGEIEIGQKPKPPAQPRRQPARRR